MNESEILRLKEIMKNLRWLIYIDERRFNTIAGAFQLLHFQKGDIIIKKDEMGDSFYLISKGRAQALIEDRSDEIREVHTFVEGEFFGEISLITGGVRTAWVVATGKMEVFTIKRADLEKHLMNMPEVAGEILDVARKRLIAINPKLAE